jgi:hypothetical protein
MHFGVGWGGVGGGVGWGGGGGGRTPPRCRGKAGNKHRLGCFGGRKVCPDHIASGVSLIEHDHIGPRRARLRAAPLPHPHNALSYSLRFLHDVDVAICGRRCKEHWYDDRHCSGRRTIGKLHVLLTHSSIPQANQPISWLKPFEFPGEAKNLIEGGP